MKIILISPYSEIQVSGVRILSACLKKEKHDVQLIFLPKHFTERYEENTLNCLVEMSKGADLIGISLITNFFDNVVQITQKLKHLNIPILWGGIHPTVRPMECLDYADMVCVGEGEKTLVELTKKMESGQDYRGIEGIWLKDRNGVIKNKISPLTQNLDSIPFPDYDYQTHFILKGKDICRMDENLLKEHMAEEYVTVPSRGCPFECTYCYNCALNQMQPERRLVRKRSIDSLIKELMWAKSELPITKVTFEDDVFFIRATEEIREFSEKYKENVGLPLAIGGATPSTLTREKLSPLVDAGLTYVRIGIQTASEQTKRLYRRHHSDQQIEKTVRLINEFKDKIKSPQYDIILDNPWEAENELIKTLMFLAKLPKPYYLDLFSLVFWPGTELYRKAREDGIITDDLRDVYRKQMHGCQKTYLNKLFFLLNRRRVPPKIMVLLTNQRLRQLKISWLLYMILYMPSEIRIKVNRVKRLLHKGWQDIQKGDWSRIVGYIKKKYA